MITIPKPKINTGSFRFGQRNNKPSFTAVQKKARSTMLDFTTYTHKSYDVNWHHVLLCSYLDRFINGEFPRLMIFMPPQHGKSELVSRRLPAFILGKFPNSQIIAASYGASLARKMNRSAQKIIDTKEYRELFPDTQLNGKNVRSLAQGSWLRNSDEFEVVGYEGSYLGAGVGGGITGKSMNWGIIDDPIKGRAVANSIVIRDSVYEWYNSDFKTRQAGPANILITLTRWHEDDLAGRLLDLAASDPAADQWTVLSLPAIADGELHPDDPREEGEALWPGRFPIEFLEREKASRQIYEWDGLYQQRPIPKGGGEFKREWFHDGVFVGAVPNGAKFCRYWDKAGSKDKGAHTAGVLLAMVNREFFVVDMIMGQWGAPERETIIKQTAIMDNQMYGRVVVAFEQEPGSGGLESAQNTVKNLAGFIVKADRPSGDKVLRSEPVQTQAEKGNLKIVKGLWNKRFLDILCSFPNGKIKDPVDALSGAFKYLTSSNSVSYADIANLGEVDRSNSPWG